MQISRNGSIGDHDYYRLTRIGMKTVSNCINGSLHQSWNIDNSKQHVSCGGDNLYKSWKQKVIVESFRFHTPYQMYIKVTTFFCFAGKCCRKSAFRD